MNGEGGSNPLAFFGAMHGAFAATLRERRGRPDLIEGLLAQAFDSFEGNAAIQSEGHPPLACHKGCAPCCVLRVTATAPEVLLIARYIRATSPLLARAGIDLAARVAECDRAARGLDAEKRAALRKRCPFIAKGICVIYRVRPLACRGHASYDKRACADALRGKAVEVPLSAAHATVRSIVQSAMQSALRDAGYPWASYELNHALQIALADEKCPAAWAEGEDVFAPALAADVSLADMAQAFDAIKAQA